VQLESQIQRVYTAEKADAGRLGCTWEQRREWARLFCCCPYKIRYQGLEKEPRATLRVLGVPGKVLAGVPGRGLGEAAARQPWQREHLP